MLRSILLALLAVGLPSCAFVGSIRLQENEPSFEVLTEQIEVARSRWSDGAVPMSWFDALEEGWGSNYSYEWDNLRGDWTLSRADPSWRTIEAILHAQRSASRVRHDPYSPIFVPMTMGGPLGTVLGLAFDVIGLPIWSTFGLVARVRLDDEWLVQGALDIAIARRLGYPDIFVVGRFYMLKSPPKHLDQIRYDEAWLAKRGITVPDVLAPDGTVSDERAAVEAARRAAQADDDA